MGPSSFLPARLERPTRPHNTSSLRDVSESATGGLSIRLVWAFVELARHDDRDALIAQLQSRFGLSRKDYEHPKTRVSLQVAADILSQLVATTGIRDIGLLAAQEVTPEHLGIVEHVARTRATLGDALASEVRYRRILGEGSFQCVAKRDDLFFVRVWFDDHLLMHDAAYEFAMATRVLTARRITGLTDLAPLEAHFMHSQPRDLTTHRQLFRCTLRFDMPSTQLVFPEHITNLALPGFEPALSRFLEEHAIAMLAELPSTDDVVLRVRDMLTAEGIFCEMNAQRMARRLGMSVRTLSRRLDRKNTSFRALLDETRRHWAQRELAQTRRPIGEIAAQLGFASSQSFYRAFRRWTGDTAAQYRSRWR